MILPQLDLLPQIFFKQIPPEGRFALLRRLTVHCEALFS
jgi:hypothetical protein